MNVWSFAGSLKLFSPPPAIVGDARSLEKTLCTFVMHSKNTVKMITNNTYVSGLSYFRFCGRAGVGVRMTEPLYVAPSLADLARDLAFPQNLPSIVCVHVLDPQPGDIILDMCAAPGLFHDC